MNGNKPHHQSSRIGLMVLSIVVLSLALAAPSLQAARVTAKVKVIIERLPLDKQAKMREFEEVVKNYIQEVDWLEDGDEFPIEISLQMFLTDLPANYEDRYKCELLISGSDVQYFDKRIRFPYQEGGVLIHSDQNAHPLTTLLDFYVNLILGSELDAIRGFGGDIYYKRAREYAAQGKFVRTEFVRGWNEREELIRKIFQEPFKTFRTMKDYFFYGLYVLEESKSNPDEQERAKAVREGRRSVLEALTLLEKVLQHDEKFETTQQFIDAHYVHIIDIFKNTEKFVEVVEQLKRIDPQHTEYYKELLEES